VTSGGRERTDQEEAATSGPADAATSGPAEHAPHGHDDVVPSELAEHGVPPEIARTLHGWKHPAILSVAFLSLAAGFAQFSVTAAMADVAAHFGEVPADLDPDDIETIADQVGLSGTALGIGLGIIRLASLGAMPLAALADRKGRRRLILACCAGGLVLTVIGAASLTYWMFIALFALARPLLSATNAVAGVIAAEETTSRHRAAAMSLVTAGYGVGAGVAAIVRGVGEDVIGFRPLFALAAVPLILVLLVSRRLEEPTRYRELHITDEASPATRLPRFGDVPTELRARLLLFAGLGFAISFATGPLNTYLFVYAEGVLGIAPSTMAVVIVLAGPIGLAGLLAGRWGADRLGRRPTAAVAQVGVAMGGAATYNLGAEGALAGYLAMVGIGAAFAPAATALASELFPTHVRSTAAGWLAASGVIGAVAGLLAFGALADLLDGFGPAALVIAIPVAVAVVGYAWLPETRGLELEESAPVRGPGVA
jgi:MFS family permease